MSESEILSQCEEYLQYLRNQGKVFYMRLNSGMAYLGTGKKRYAVKLAPEGTADILIIRPSPCIYTLEDRKSKKAVATGDMIISEVIWIETKDEKGVQSEVQKTFQEEVEALGCNYFIVRNLDELISIIGEGK